MSKETVDPAKALFRKEPTQEWSLQCRETYLDAIELEGG